jgi:hypothetical protein
LSFEDDPAFPDADHTAGPQIETWLLLHYYDAKSEEIRVELSCPDAMAGKQVSSWSARIILQSVPFSTDLEIPLEDDDVDDIDIDVSRRAD